jgi:hypothetical protein
MFRHQETTLKRLWLLLLPAIAGADQNITRDYGVSTTINTCLAVYADPVDFEASATFEAGDVVVMKDEGTPANIGTLPTDEGTCYSIPLTATEMQAERVTVTLVDQTGTKVWMDHAIYIETYGDASSQHPDIDPATAQQRLEILQRGLSQNDTTIATLASQVSFTLTAGSSDDDAYNPCTAMITDQSTAEQIAMGDIMDYTGSTKTVLLRFDPGIFTMATGDLVTITCLGR